MKNVYESVRIFFEEELNDPTVISREWIEGFLRHRAWSGATDKELRDLWKHINIFQMYLLYNTPYQSLTELIVEDYVLAFRWLEQHCLDFKVTLKSVRHFFLVLELFYEYLASRRVPVSLAELQFATQQITGGKRLNLSLLQRPRLVSAQVDPEEIPALIERLMLKLGNFFQDPAFVNDFNRALYLYTGPLQSAPASTEPEFAEFWIGFWDYFLFDYRLRLNDCTPVSYYLQQHTNISAAEKSLLTTLINARFTVFYVKRIVDLDFVECVNLLTDEVFRMPYPDIDQSLTKRLFFGHIFNHDAFVANFISSVEVSTKLRQRIKQEIVRLKMLFEIQVTDASWDGFLARHCLVARHTILLLTSFAKLTVADSISLLSVTRPPAIKEQPPSEVADEIKRLMKKLDFSTHDFTLAQTLWQDFCQVAKIRYTNPKAWALAVIVCYAAINTPLNLSINKLATDETVVVSTIYSRRRQLQAALSLHKRDPRYLSEEGFLLLLYSP